MEIGAGERPILFSVFKGRMFTGAEAVEAPLEAEVKWKHQK